MKLVDIRNERKVEESSLTIQERTDKIITIIRNYIILYPTGHFISFGNIDSLDYIEEVCDSLKIPASKINESCLAIARSYTDLDNFLTVKVSNKTWL